MSIGGMGGVMMGGGPIGGPGGGRGLGLGGPNDGKDGGRGGKGGGKGERPTGSHSSAISHFPPPLAFVCALFFSLWKRACTVCVRECSLQAAAARAWMAAVVREEAVEGVMVLAARPVRWGLADRWVLLVLVAARSPLVAAAV